MNEYFDAKILNSKWTPKFFNVSIPNSNNLEEYQNVLMKLDASDSNPEIFGLSSASAVSRNITICRNLLKNLRKIYFNIDDSENYEKRIRPLIAMWRKAKNVSWELFIKYFTFINHFLFFNSPSTSTPC